MDLRLATLKADTHPINNIYCVGVKYLVRNYIALIQHEQDCTYSNSHCNNGSRTNNQPFLRLYIAFGKSMCTYQRCWK
jgi:hypothetical protein